MRDAQQDLYFSSFWTEVVSVGSILVHGLYLNYGLTEQVQCSFA
jgi:hypothetical protein